jgi:polyhydroxyalkanoate synthesis regulator phasin
VTPRRKAPADALPDPLRAAVERTFAATSGSAAETRERAAELLDEVVRRGQEARGAMESASREAAEAALRTARGELKGLERRLAELERKVKPQAKG